MSIPNRFMEIARSTLDREMFDNIYARAVELERKAVIRQRVNEPSGTPAVVERVAAHLNGEDKPKQKPTPHAAEQINRRMGIEVDQTDLGELLQIAKGGGPNVETIRQSMQTVREVAVNWRGKHFVVVYSSERGRDRMITAYPRKKKRAKIKVPAGRPKDWRSLDDLDAN